MQPNFSKGKKKRKWSFEIQNYLPNNIWAIKNSRYYDRNLESLQNKIVYLCEILNDLENQKIYYLEQINNFETRRVGLTNKLGVFKKLKGKKAFAALSNIFFHTKKCFSWKKKIYMAKLVQNINSPTEKHHKNIKLSCDKVKNKISTVVVR